MNIFKDFKPDTGNIFSLDFLCIWLISFICIFFRMLKYNPKLESTIADYISSLTGYEFHTDWIDILVIIIGIMVIIMFTLLTDNTILSRLNIFKKKQSSYSSQRILYKKKSQSSRKKKK